MEDAVRRQHAAAGPDARQATPRRMTMGIAGDIKGIETWGATGVEVVCSESFHIMHDGPRLLSAPPVHPLDRLCAAADCHGSPESSHSGPGPVSRPLTMSEVGGVRLPIVPAFGPVFRRSALAE